MRHGRVAALVMAGALLAGCGTARGDQEDHRDRKGVQDDLRIARAEVTQAGSARIDATMDTGGRLRTRSGGTLDWTDGVRGTLTVRVTGGELAASTRALGGDPSQTRYLPDAYYTRMSDRFARLQKGRHWIRHPYDTQSDLGPAGCLKTLVETGDAYRVAAETVRGARTTHYRGTAGEQRIDVWVDARHLLVRRTQRAGDFTSTVHYRDYGARAAAERPPARDTLDLADVRPADG
ncbi:hypothetical protein GTW43_03325 [Streptomyces sp. SID5785]|uniref:hypothetical protein n=1 Tax=Streptomyces sp. SID5785 TaxID=2690309 RepID=UPI001361E5DC|nr:hypothetical protein [Streptomyces sp. SID5785]MZD04117.1 hypothetical protein [Streptomyces sp. SID5785]